MTLKPAILYKDEIIKRSQELFYTDDLFFYNGYIGNAPINIVDADELGGIYQYAILDNEKLIGYISFRIDWVSLSAYNFGLISFDKGNPVIGFAVRQIMNRIINEYHIHRIEFRCVGGNPVKKHYDKFCNHYNGRCLTLYDVSKDRTGNYHNEYLYEIICNNTYA